MYVIIFTISFILLLEIFNFLPTINIDFQIKNNQIKKIDKFNEYSSDISFEKYFDPGRLYTNEMYNLFIIKNNESFLVKKDEIYEINEPFILKYININEKNMKYYYI